MNRKFRLTRSTDFKRVRRMGKSYANPLLVLVTYSNLENEKFRVGIAAGKSVGNAVHRNRAKRQIRSAIQLLSSDINPGWDLVVLARNPINEAEFAEILQSLENLLKKAGIMQEKKSSK